MGGVSLWLSTLNLRVWWTQKYKVKGECECIPRQRDFYEWKLSSSWVPCQHIPFVRCHSLLFITIWPPVIKELTLKIRHVVHQQIASLFLVLSLKVLGLYGFPYLIQRWALQPVCGEWVARLSCPLSSGRLEEGEGKGECSAWHCYHVEGRPWAIENAFFCPAAFGLLGSSKSVKQHNGSPPACCSGCAVSISNASSTQTPKYCL